MTIPDARDRPTGREFPHPEIALALLFAAGAFALRLFRLGDQSLWNDEMFSINVASQPLVAIPGELAAHYHHPPLYFLILHYFLGLFGQTAWALRLPSAVFGASSAGLGAYVAYRASGRRAALIAGSLILIAPFHLAYSQEGRPYALAGLFCLAAFHGAFEMARSSNRRWTAYYVVSLTALLYTHHWGIFVLFSHVAALFFRRSALTSHQKRTYLLSWLVTVLLYLPEYVALRQQMALVTPDGWFWVRGPDGSELYHLFLAYSGTFFAMASSIFTMPLLLQLSGGAALAVLLLPAVRSAAGHGTAAPGLATACVVWTLIIAWTTSWFKPEVFLWYRYTVILLPLLLVGVGTAFVESGTSPPGRRWSRFRRAAGTAAFCTILLTGMASDVRYYSWQKANAKDVARYVGEITSRDSISIVIRPAAFAFLLNYYYRGAAAQYDEGYLNGPLGAVVDTARAFVYVSLDVPNEIRAYMDSHFRKIAERTFPGEAHMGIIVGAYRQKEDRER